MIDRWITDGWIICFSACTLVLAIGLAGCPAANNGAQQGAANQQADRGSTAQQGIINTDKSDRSVTENKPTITGQGPIVGSGNQGVIVTEAVLYKAFALYFLVSKLSDVARDVVAGWRRRRRERRYELRTDRPNG